MDRRIGAQFYTVCDFTETIEDFDITCRKIKEIGYRIVQISGTPLKADEMKSVLDQYGLQVVTTHKDVDTFFYDLDAIVEYNRVLGSQLCGLGYLPPEWCQTEEKLDLFIREVNRVAKALRQEDLYFGYHNHAHEFAKIGGKRIMDRLLRETDPEAVKLIVDTYWLQIGGMNPETFIRQQGDRIWAAHFKDLAMDLDNTPKMAEIGEGNLNWDGIIAACEEAGVKWALVEQDTCERDPFESLKMSYDFLTTKGFC